MRLTQDDEEELYGRIKVLNERLWDRRVLRPDVDAWLGNFSSGENGEPCERSHALYLLSRFIYFAQREVRELLRALYRDLYRAPIVMEFRRANGDTLDPHAIDAAARAALASTRFLGLGNPAESGTHLLYYFRQENDLPKRLFKSVPDLFDRNMADDCVRLAERGVRRFIFIDDFSGSGSQAIRYSRNVLGVLRDVEKRYRRRFHVSCLMLAARTSALDRVRKEADYDVVDAVLQFDDSYRSVSPDSRHFKDAPDGITQTFAREMALRYGTRLDPTAPLGFEDSELLLGFDHNIPNNTLPVIWWDKPPWKPAFRRYSKNYGA